MGAAAANVLLIVAGAPGAGIPLRFATAFFLGGVYPLAFKLISTWFRGGRGMALWVLATAIVVGNGMPRLVNRLGGLDWQLVIDATSALALVGGMIAGFAVLAPGPILGVLAMLRLRLGRGAGAADLPLDSGA